MARDEAREGREVAWLPLSRLLGVLARKFELLRAEEINLARGIPKVDQDKVPLSQAGKVHWYIRTCLGWIAVTCN